MSSWATKRKYTIVSILGLLVLIPLYGVFYAYTHKPPTCFDNKRNQDELGIDCGGACALLCSTETADALISWHRLLPVDNGIYTAVAYIENPNINAGAKNVPYIFKVYGEEGVVVYERKGRTDLYPKTTYAIVEPGILTGQRIPTRTTFEFVTQPVWEREPERVVPLVVKEKIITKEDTSPRIEAEIQNMSVETQRDITVVAIAYDAGDNALGASKTIIERLNKGESKRVVFTWPNKFTEKVSRIEIVPSI